VSNHILIITLIFKHQKTFIMKQFYFLCFLFLSIGNTELNAQCATTNMFFSNNADVEAFANSYPLCPSIFANVTIQNNVTNLSKLWHITYIEGNLNINSTQNLSDLSGLNNLTVIGGNLNIQANRILNLWGLND